MLGVLMLDKIFAMRSTGVKDRSVAQNANKRAYIRPTPKYPVVEMTNHILISGPSSRILQRKGGNLENFYGNLDIWVQEVQAQSALFRASLNGYQVIPLDDRNYHNQMILLKTITMLYLGMTNKNEKFQNKLAKEVNEVFSQWYLAILLLPYGMNKFGPASNWDNSDGNFLGKQKHEYLNYATYFGIIGSQFNIPFNPWTEEVKKLDIIDDFIPDEH
jgi:hypothetical protein